MRRLSLALLITVGGRYRNQGWREESVWPAGVSIIQAIAWSPDANYLAAWGTSRLVLLRLRRSRSGGTLAVSAPVQLDENSSGGGIVAFSPDGRLLAASLNSGMIRLYSVATRERVGLMRPDDQYHIAASPLSFSPDGRLLAGGTLERIYVFSTEQRRLLEAHQFVRYGRVVNFWFTADGRFIVSAGIADSVLRIRPVDVAYRDTTSLSARKTGEPAR
jgi:WD40 repeat protein